MYGYETYICVTGAKIWWKVEVSSGSSMWKATDHNQSKWPLFSMTKWNEKPVPRPKWWLCLVFYIDIQLGLKPIGIQTKMPLFSMEKSNISRTNAFLIWFQSLIFIVEYWL